MSIMCNQFSGRFLKNKECMLYLGRHGTIINYYVDIFKERVLFSYLNVNKAFTALHSLLAIIYVQGYTMLKGLWVG
jgi:hypothetical protein